MMDIEPQPRTRFDWAIYADATFAGLAVLIPIPFVDWAFERFFRRRMPAAIAKRHGRELSPTVLDRLNRSNGRYLAGCLALPVKGVIKFLKRLSRKILYFLTVKEAADKVSEYWHRAFLMDYMLEAGHLESEESARVARQAMDRVLSQTGVSPLIQLARQVTGSTRHVFSTLRRAKHGRENEVVQEKRSQMKQRWADFEDYFKRLATEYHQSYRELIARRIAEKDPVQRA